jgi:nucleotidyltransferase/DNA polymerase involved in DNA repair
MTTKTKKSKTKSDLQQIPGVGPRLEEDLQLLGYHSVTDLAGANAEDMYDRLCAKMGSSIDRCVLYVFRGAVYYASRKKHDPELLKWWNWSDKNQNARDRLSRGKKVK